MTVDLCVTQTNGTAKTQRKQLSDQIDRLDSILDGLAEALNESIADAARIGAREAVKELFTELLSDPTILSLLHATSTPGNPPSPEPQSFSFWAKARQRIHGVTATVSNKLQAFLHAVKERIQRVASQVKSVTSQRFPDVSPILKYVKPTGITMLQTLKSIYHRVTGTISTTFTFLRLAWMLRPTWTSPVFMGVSIAVVGALIALSSSMLAGVVAGGSVTLLSQEPTAK